MCPLRPAADPPMATERRSSSSCDDERHVEGVLQLAELPGAPVLLTAPGVGYRLLDERTDEIDELVIERSGS